MAKRGKKLRLTWAILAVTAAPAPSRASSLYVIEATDGFTAVNASYNDVTDAVDTVTRRRLLDLFRPLNPAFDPDLSAIRMTVHARGVDVNLDAAAGSPAFTLTVPATGLRRVFAGKTRDESARAVVEWFKKEGLTGTLGRKFAELSSIDPLAGNPNSAQARTVNASFDRGFSRIASLGDAGAPGEASASATGNANVAYVGGSYRRNPGGDYRSGSYTLPLGYAWRFDDDARHQISFDLPLTYQSVEGGHVYTLGAGLGYSHPITDHWVLTPAVDYGAAASLNLGSAGHVLTGSLTSIVTVPVTRWLLVHVGNMVGHSQTLRLSAGDFASDPGIKEFVTKNGLMLYFSTSRLLRSTGFELFAADTRFLGTKLYDGGYTEVGASFGISRVTVDGGKRYDSVARIGVSWLFARGNDAVTVNAGYLF